MSIHSKTNSTYSHMVTPNILNRKNSLDKAMKILNGREIDHQPPSTFFIRRNTLYLQKYKNKNEYDQLLEKVPKEYKKNYNVFKMESTD